MGAAPQGCLCRWAPRSEQHLVQHSAMDLPQVLSKEEYACWLQSHLEAESSPENSEELLFQSAIRLETNLHLLGN